jgi:hypothetical protein
MIARILGRIMLVVLMAGLVVTFTSMAAPRDQPKTALLREPLFAMDAAVPGGADAIRRAINDIQAGHTRPQDRQMLSALGPLQTVTYNGADQHGDLYTTKFPKGSLLWTVSVGEGGKIQGLIFDAPRGPTPQNWIDWFALLPMRGRVAGQIFALIKLLAVIGFGRMARIHL